MFNRARQQALVVTSRTANCQLETAELVESPLLLPVISVVKWRMKYCPQLNGHEKKRFIRVS